MAENKNRAPLAAPKYKPTTEQLRELWVKHGVRPVNVPEKVEAEVGFDEWFEDVTEQARDVGWNSALDAAALDAWSATTH